MTELTTSVDQRLWCLHHIGPDDVHPAPDFATAQEWANHANEFSQQYAGISRFVVAVWPWTAKLHADGLEASIADWSPVPAPMTPEEHRLEDLKQMAAYTGPVVSFEVRETFYLASCDHCGWVGSSELCGTDSFGDDSDVYCPRCGSPGADGGKVAERIPAAHL